MPLEKIEDPIAVGLEQLTVAIDLFIQERSYVSAITLAIAAENIFERALKEKSQSGVLRWEFEFFDQIGQTFPHADENKRFAEFRSSKMIERNFANHGPDNRNPSSLIRPPQEVAEEAIDRALTNLHCLGLPRPPAADRFQAWMLENVVGFPDATAHATIKPRHYQRAFPGKGKSY